MTAQPDVPILVETPARDFFPMVRCHYLCIECDTPTSEWRLGVEGLTMPFLMLGLSGVVLQPFAAPQFNNPGVIEHFFAELEQQPSLSINFEDIWLPGVLFHTPPHVGAVYRVRRDLFQLAHQFRDRQVNQQDFETRCIELRRQILFSKEETKAFEVWSAEQILGAERRRQF